jgi:hypothetical protein
VKKRKKSKQDQMSDLIDTYKKNSDRKLKVMNTVTTNQQNLQALMVETNEHLKTLIQMRSQERREQ